MDLKYQGLCIYIVYDMMCKYIRQYMASYVLYKMNIAHIMTVQMYDTVGTRARMI